MDLSPALRRGALRIAQSLHRYAASKSWSKQDYRVFMIVNNEWDRFNAELVAHAFDHGRTTSDYIDAMHFVEADLRDEPELYRAFGLVLRPFAGYAFFARRNWPPNTVEVDDTLLNPMVDDLRGSFAPIPQVTI